MMHDPTGHPDDERLSALAAGDGDATDDRALRGHVGGCARCSEMVDDLSSLRLALAQLPDIAPPRPLRLLPGVPDRAAATGLGGFARRLFAPALAAGLLLIAAGGIGTYAERGIPLLTSAGAGGASYEALGEGQPAPAAAPSDGARSADNAAGGRRVPSGARQTASEPVNAGVPWLLAILAAGVVLVLAALLARFVIQPRAG